jgi:prepilin-type processing-associated H-X9-DG protein
MVINGRFHRSQIVHPGITLIECLVVIAICSLVIGLTVAGIMKVRARSASVQCLNNVRSLGLALQNYHDTHKHFPPGVSVESDGGRYPYLSWLARLLPFVEQGPLWSLTMDAFRAEKDFLVPTAHPARGTVVPLFLCPSDGRIREALPISATHAPVAFTSYLGVLGRNAGQNDGVLYLDSKTYLADVTDGASNTIAIGERPPSAGLRFGWWYAGWGQQKNGDAEMILGSRTSCYSSYQPGCDQGPYHFIPESFDSPCSAFHFWSPHAGGAHFGFADGSARFLPYSADPILPALSTRAGREIVDVP